jgi:predicted MPP superfamily phosphohydrolase
MVRNADIQLLSNASCQIHCKGTALQIVGVGDMWTRELDAPKAFEAVTPHDPAILLSHNPDSKAPVADRKWDLMLSGHTHRGQVVVPVLGINPAPVWTGITSRE